MGIVFVNFLNINVLFKCHAEQLFSGHGHQNLVFDRFWSMFSNPKHVLCTNEIIWHISQVWWLPKALKLSSVLYFIRAPSWSWSEKYTFLVYTWYWRFIFANNLIQESSELLTFKKKKKINFPGSAQRKCLEKMTQPFCHETPFSNSTEQSWEPS